MPWTPQEFQSRHAKHLSLDQAGHAASVAEAMMGRGVPEGEAIATGISKGEKRKPTSSPPPKKKGLQDLINSSGGSKGSPY